MLEEEIEIEAIDIATDSLMKADEKKKLEELDRIIEKKNKVKEKAKEIIEEYEDRLDDRVFELALEQVDEITEDRYEKDIKKKKEEPEKKEEKKKVTTTKKIVRKKITEDKD